jgi:hypothetical protein
MGKATESGLHQLRPNLLVKNESDNGAHKDDV